VLGEYSPGEWNSFEKAGLNPCVEQVRGDVGDIDGMVEITAAARSGFVRGGAIAIVH